MTSSPLMMITSSAIVGLVAGALGGGSVALALRSPPPIAAPRAAPSSAIDQQISAYLAAHPEEILASLRSGETAAKAKAIAVSQAAIQSNKAAIVADTESPSVGPVTADVTITEFFDYRCPYCKSSAPGLENLVASDPHIRVVFKDIPVLGKLSDYEARLALAAQKHGQYHQLHTAFFSIKGTVDEDAVRDAVRSVGLDPIALSAEADAPEIRDQVKTNLDLANKIGVTGTPAWVVNDQFAPGNADPARLAQLVSTARSAHASN